MKNIYKILLLVASVVFFADTTYAVVIINASPPSANITSPSSNVTVSLNQMVAFSGNGTYSPCTMFGCIAPPTVTAYEWRESICTSGTLLSTASSFNLSTPTPGVRTIYFRTYSSNGWSTNCPSRVVTISAPVGTVNVSTNISASWTITGPTTIVGSGTSQSSPSKPTGTYTISWGTVSGYITPPSQSLTLASAGVITFSGAYSAVPTLTTPTHTAITTTGAALGANLTSLGYPSVISSRGTCWGTFTNPTTNCIAEGGNTTGTFTHARTGMTGATTYYYRGYATNSTGTGYSSSGTFTTGSASCTFGASTILSGSSIIAYQFSSVPSPSTCASVSETRTCANGTLSGSYSNQSCSVATSCATPWGTTVASGSSVPAYQFSTVSAPATCSSIQETRSCTNGALSGTYNNQNCAVVKKAKFWQF